MKRRKFLALVGGATAAWPLAASAQQAVLPVMGYLNSRSPDGDAAFLAAFHHGLNESGYVEGQNVAIEYRWAEGRYDRLPALAADLVRRKVAVIAATTTPAALAAKAATSAIPIVFTGAVDAIAAGLVVNINRPSSNATGVNFYISALGAKRLELMHELIPNAAAIGMLVNPNYADAKSQWNDVKEAARAIGLQVHVVNASSEGDFDKVFATLVQLKVDALLVGSDSFLFNRRNQLVALAARHALPAMYPLREYAAAGGLISYAANLVDGYRQAGIYVARILKGAKPGDLPVVQPTKFDLVINLKTAKALGLTVPQSLLVAADEVIE
jgi:putative ABC transport system substrate-binding protein